MKVHRPGIIVRPRAREAIGVRWRINSSVSRQYPSVTTPTAPRVTHQCVEHDDVNVLCLGAQIVGDRLAFDLLRAYLAAEFSTSEEFRRRVAKLAEIERTP